MANTASYMANKAKTVPNMALFLPNTALFLPSTAIPWGLYASILAKRCTLDTALAQSPHGCYTLLGVQAPSTIMVHFEKKHVNNGLPEHTFLSSLINVSSSFCIELAQRKSGFGPRCRFVKRLLETGPNSAPNLGFLPFD